MQLPFSTTNARKKCRQKWTDFKQSAAYKKFLDMFDDYIRRFSFVDEVTNKPFMLTRYATGITAVSSVYAEAVTKTPLVTESAKRRLERPIRTDG